jgi:NAD(P)-dependent dehydrogenase (short-subunit alcohol dehydrogenase family)
MLKEEISFGCFCRETRLYMSNQAKTVIVTGASQGIGAGVVNDFLNRGYNVVATSRTVSKSNELRDSAKLVRIEGEVGDPETAKRVADAAIGKFGRIDALVANAGFFISKPFPEYTSEDFQKLMSVNVEGFNYIAQLTVKQMLVQKTGGSVIAITASLVKNPIAGFPVSVQMIAKGGLEAAVRSLAIEYAKDGIRFNAVAPGIVETPLTKDLPKDFLKTLSPMGVIAEVKDISDAIVYLTEARYVTGEVLHVDGGLHSGKW